MLDIIPWIERLYLTATFAVLAVLALRVPVRRCFGPRIAYPLWCIVPCALVGAILPARAAIPTTMADAIGKLASGAGPAPPGLSAASIVAFWLAGAVLCASLLWWRSRLAVRRVGKAGAAPLVVGAVAGRILLPPDYETRFTGAERVLLRAEAQTRIAHWAPRISAVLAGIQALSWFNPIVHWGARLARLDERAATDAVLVGRFPRATSTYAALVAKAGGADGALRVRLIGAPRPSAARGWTGAAALCLLAAAAILAAWAWRSDTGGGLRLVGGFPFVRAFGGVPQARLRVTGAALRVIVIPEVRSTVETTIFDRAGPLPPPHVTRQGAGQTIDGGLSALALRPAWLGGLRCERGPQGVVVRIGGRRLEPSQLPLAVVRTPLHVRIVVSGAVFGDVRTATDLALDNGGCGDWRIGRVTGVLALLDRGAGQIHAAQAGEHLAVALAGSGNVAVDKGDLQTAGLENTGSGTVTYSGDTVRMNANAWTSGDIKVGTVIGLAVGSLSGSGALCMTRRDAGRICRPGPGD